jgi:hypothetical protein
MRSAIIVAGLLLCCAACSDERRYIGEDGSGVFQVALTANTPAAFTSNMDSLYVVETRVELPVKKPSASDLSSLRSGSAKPFPRLPWVKRGDLELQVDFTLTNLDGDAREAAVIVNGFDEFFEYQPGVTVNDDQLVIDYSQWERLYKLEPKTRITRTIREEELDEVAIDLATAVNGAPNANQVVYFENHSATDTRDKPYIPKVIPGLMGFRIGLRATEPGKLLLEASVRVRDTGDRLADMGAPAFKVHPEPFTPMPPMDNNQ